MVKLRPPSNVSSHFTGTGTGRFPFANIPIRNLYPMADPIPYPPALSDGFVQVPRPVFDRLLSTELTKRELKVLLLVARLTYGCRNQRWAALKKADLMAVGIGPTHAGACLKTLLDRGILVQSGERSEYRLAERSGATRGMLAALVGRQLAGTYRDRKVSARNGKAKPTALGKQTLPNEEEIASRNGSLRAHFGRRMRASESRFTQLGEVAIDKLKTIKDKDIQGELSDSGRPNRRADGRNRCR